MAAALSALLLAGLYVTSNQKDQKEVSVENYENMGEQKTAVGNYPVTPSYLLSVKINK